MNQAGINPRRWAALFAAGTAVIFGTVGCGSGSGSSPAPSPSPISSGISSAVVTRGTENTLSEDAKILATRQATGAFVSLDLARAFEADLTKIRAAYPAVQNVHTRPDFLPKTLLLLVKPSAPWLPKWEASALQPSRVTETDLTTGEAALDALLKKYDATRTTDTIDFGDTRYVVLRFAASLNMRAVAAEFAQSSSNIVSAETDGTSGDGDNVVFVSGGEPIGGSIGGGSSYVFSQGFGDCPAGCINHYNHTYTFKSDGGIGEAITGTPPPLYSGGGG